jgi:hypothetical protein
LALFGRLAIDWKAFYAEGFSRASVFTRLSFQRQSFALDFTTEKEKDGDLGTDPSERQSDLGTGFTN